MDMAVKVIDGELFEKISQGAAVNLQINKQALNDLNVFPVPDGDTGSNMYATFMGGYENMIAKGCESLQAKARAMADGMLLSARGNSGVILSQLYHGIAQGLLGLEVATITQFATALQEGVRYAYKAVVNPVEGTILTVAREGAEGVSNDADKYLDVQNFFDSYLSGLKHSLQRTPELLKVLKQSKVVDSGGAGLVCIAEGFLDAILGKSSAELFPSKVKNEGVACTLSVGEGVEFGYCTEALVQLVDKKCHKNPFDLQRLREFLTSIGDSVVAVQVCDKVKLHVHTLQPHKVIENCLTYGDFISVKIENMTLQHSNLTTERVQEASLCDNAGEERKSCAVVAVASGEGFAQLYSEFGADVIVRGGVTNNPSTEQFIKAFKEANADTIVLLPNDKNVVLAGEQAGKLFEHSKVIVLPTKSAQQVYSALMVITDKEDLECLIADVNMAIEGVRSCSLTAAVRDAEISEKAIKKGEYMFIGEGALISSEQSKIGCFKRGLRHMLDEGCAEIITLFYGDNVSAEERDQIRDFVQTNYGDVELIEYESGQSVYDLLIALE